MTGLAAERIGAEGTGRLEVGRRADLLVCSEDVVRDPRGFLRGALHEVVQDGRGHRGGIAELPQRGMADTARVVLGEPGAGSA